MINTIDDIIKDSAINNRVSDQSKEQLKTLFEYENEYINNLLYKFFFINNEICDHGGLPVLKTIKDYLVKYYK